MGDVQEWSNAKNILCVRLDSMGDVLMMTPAIRALKETVPERKITLLTSTSGGKISPLIPEIDNTLIYDPPWIKSSAPPLDSASDFQIIDRLRGLHFDGAVLFTTFSQSPLPAALLTYLADIPLRLAYCRENPYHLLTEWVSEIDHVGSPIIRHEVQRQLDLVAFIGSETSDEHLSLRVPEHLREKVHKLLLTNELDTRKPWIVLHPGATAPSRRYRADHYREVSQDLISNYDLQVVFTGNETEVELVEEIRRNIPGDSFSLAGKLNVGELSALIAMADLLITNNTGPAHIAAAVQTPVVVLYALTNPQHIPWMVAQRVLYHNVPCKYCYKSICPMGHHNCLELVSPETVLHAVFELLVLNELRK